MRIKEEIKRSGAFWIPSSPERQISGTLSIVDGGSAKLELTEPIDNRLEAFGSGQIDNVNQILGHVEKDGPVLIDRCYQMQRKKNFVYGKLIASDVIWADRVLTRLPHSEDTDLCFNTLTISVEGIDEWVGISGIKVNRLLEEHAVTISYNLPMEVSINLADSMQLLITFGYTIPGIPSTKKAEVTQKTYFKLVSQEARELGELTSAAQKITAFLCFVMNEIVCLDSLVTTSDSHNRHTGGGLDEPITAGVYCRTWPYSKETPQINELDMLFKFKDIRNKFEGMINKWLDNYEQISPALDLYFLTKTGRMPSVNLYFLTLVQGLEAFHQRISKDKNLSLRNRLNIMTDTFHNFMCGDKRSQLIDEIIKTRNYLTHYDSELEQKAAKGQMLEFLCRKMKVLFRLHFLKIIGFNEHEINDIVDKYSYFKGECNL